MKYRYLAAAAALVFAGQAFAQAGAPPAQSSGPQDPAMPLVQQARKLNAEGKQDEAIALYQKAIEQSPKLYPAWAGQGAAYDLMGDYAKARQDFQKAIEVATDQQKPQAMKTMAISYAFECKTEDAARFEKPVYEEQLKAAKFYDAGETADELARIYIECGDTRNAAEWYKKGRDAGIKKPDLTQKERDLWDFRYEHAQARIAARKGDKNAAEKHVAAARAIIDRGTLPEQAQFFPYLKGYVALYTGDPKGALEALKDANQRDPFILLLEAQANEKSGNQSQAMDLYHKIMEINIHNPTNAFARPIARARLAGKQGS